MENKNIKFEPNVPVEVTLAFDQPKTGDGEYGTWYLYGTKALITGESGFFATELLHKKIQEAGLSMGDTFTIIKVSKDNKTFFNIEHPEVPLKKVSDNQVNVSKPGQRELTLEQKVTVMWKEYERKHPAPTEGDLPF